MHLRKTRQGIEWPFTLTQCDLSYSIRQFSHLSLSFLIGIRFFSTDFHGYAFPHTCRSWDPENREALDFNFHIWNQHSSGPPFHTREKFPSAQETQFSSYQANILIESSFSKLTVKAVWVSARILWWQPPCWSPACLPAWISLGLGNELR